MDTGILGAAWEEALALKRRIALFRHQGSTTPWAALSSSSVHFCPARAVIPHAAKEVWSLPTSAHLWEMLETHILAVHKITLRSQQGLAPHSSTPLIAWEGAATKYTGTIDNTIWILQLLGICVISSKNFPMHIVALQILLKKISSSWFKGD